MVYRAILTDDAELDVEKEFATLPAARRGVRRVLDGMAMHRQLAMIYSPDFRIEVRDHKNNVVMSKSQLLRWYTN